MHRSWRFIFDFRMVLIPFSILNPRLTAPQHQALASQIVGFLVGWWIKARGCRPPSLCPSAERAQTSATIGSADLSYPQV